MYILDIVFHYGASQKFIYGDDADGASQDYEKVKAALNDFRQFKNDNIMTVEIDKGSPSGRATLRLEHIMSVSITDMTASKQGQLDWAAYVGELDGRHAQEKARVQATTP